MAFFDDIFDDFPLHHSLRIPPLIDPLPFISATSGRPSPLEPNARVNANIDNETAKLTGRRKALAEAKPLGDGDSNDLRPLRKNARDDLRPIQKSPRKRQKLYDHEHIADFVQLPKPKAKIKEEKPPPFQPISVLNELHEPPPSAALFPPITPSAMQDEEDWLLSTEMSTRSIQPSEKSAARKRRLKEPRDDAPPSRRVSHRPHRMKWSKKETEYLIKGVAIYGMGKWKKILQHSEFSFQEGRTPVDLKDRFRTCCPQQVSQRQRNFSDENASHNLDGVNGSPLGSGLTALTSRDPNDAIASLPQAKVPRRHTPRSPGPNRKRARRKPWNDAEDAALAEGYRQHGFQWTQIAKDPTLCLSNRTGNQVRDRFRLKYPDLYGGEGATSQDIATSINEVGRRVSLSRAGQLHDQSEDEDEDQEDSEGDELDSEIDGSELQSQKISSSAGLRSSVAAPHDIMNLLNGEEEDNHPLASLRYDDWDENVTLPPLLLWEDMATRPMFDLE